MKSFMALLGRLTSRTAQDDGPDHFDLRVKTAATPVKRATQAHPAPHLFRRQGASTSSA